MKKRILALALAAVMALSLTACGEKVDKTAVTEAFNTANTKLTEITTLVNENLDIIDQESIDFLTTVTTSMQSYKDEIEGDEMTQERADEVTGLLNGALTDLDTIKANVETYLADAATADEAMTEEQLAALGELAVALIEVGGQYDPYVEYLNEDSMAFLQQIADTIADISLMASDAGSYTSAQADEVIAGAQQMLEAATAGLAELEAQVAG